MRLYIYILQGLIDFQHKKTKVSKNKEMGRCPTPTGRDDENNNLKKGAWTPEEDQILIDYIQAHGHGSWRALPKLAGDHSSVSLSLHTQGQT